MRTRTPLLLAATLLLSVSPFAPARAAGPPVPPPTPFFKVGAAAVDVTPPLAGSASNPAACAGAEAYTGPHLLSLEEPYKDTNGNGRHDAGEPFLDCPTPLANGGTAPPDNRWDGIYLGGGDCCDRQPTAVLDPIWARTLVVSRGGYTLSLTSVDNEGVFKEIWDEVRAKVRADGVTGIDEMLFSSTHDESAPDTIGITGPDEFTSGSDPFYVQFLIARTAQSIEDAYAKMVPASIHYGQVRPDDMVPCWSSYPFAADEQIGVMQAVDQHGSAVVTLINYGIHAEELGFSDDSEDRLHLSSDWHHFARNALEARYGGVAMTLAGSVGSVEMPQVYPTARDLTPINEHSSSGNGGCRTIYATDDTLTPYGYDLSTRARGERIASWAERALDAGEISRSGAVEARRETLFLPLDNQLFAVATVIGVIPGKRPFLDDVELTRTAAGKIIPPVFPNEFQTDIAWFRIGDGEFVSAPGEVFPYTLARDFGGPDDQAVPDGLDPPPWVMAKMSQPYRFVAGLGEDMVGYMFPSTNAVGVPLTLGDTDDTDRFGCGHSDDGEAAAVAAGDILAATLESLLPTPGEPIRVGRYIDQNGGMHRSPLGDGGQQCSGDGNVFHPIPGGEAVRVWVLPAGVTTFAPGVGYQIPIGVATQWHWMNVRGRPEKHASTQTRGVISPTGRIWIDVFPETTGP